METYHPTVVPDPDPSEREALEIVAAYLSRAGVTVATYLLQGGLRWQEATELAEVRDQLRRAGALCGGMAEGHEA